MAFSRSEKNVVTVAFGLLGLISFVLFLDFAQSTLPGLQKIGRTDSVVADVERRYSGQAVWQTIENSSDIYDYDIIRTEADSEANLMVQGVAIHLGPNSFVMIHFEKNRIELNVKRGSVEVDDKHVGKPEVRIVSVMRFTAPGKSTAGTRQSSVTLLSPGPDAVKSVSGQNGSVHFSWANSPGAAMSELIVSHDSAFADPVKPVPSYGTRITLDVPPGTYFWKVKAQFADGRTAGVSEIRRFFVARGTGAAETAVTPGSRELFSRHELHEGVLFNWVRDPESTADVFQMAPDKDFTAPLFERTVPTNHFVLKEPVGGGTYYWRTRGTVGGKAGSFSRAVPVRIAPEIFSPDEVHPTLLLPARDSIVDMTDPDTLGFRWQGVPGTALYRLRVFHALRGHQILVHETEMTRTEAVLSDLTKLDRGRFFWSVEAVRQPGAQRSLEGPARNRFDITLDEAPIRLKRHKQM